MWSSPCRRDGEVEKSALRAVTFFPLMVKGKAWFRIKDPPSREGQEGLFTIHPPHNTSDTPQK